jgi:hypothetical protein
MKACVLLARVKFHWLILSVTVALIIFRYRHV